MAPWLRDVCRGPSLIPTLTWWLTTAWNSRFRGSTPSSDLHRHCMHVAHRHTCSQSNPTHKKIVKKRNTFLRYHGSNGDDALGLCCGLQHTITCAIIELELWALHRAQYKRERDARTLEETSILERTSVWPPRHGTLKYITQIHWLLTKLSGLFTFFTN